MANLDIGYKTHILIGVRASGTMTVICHWSHVPRQAEVQQHMQGAKEPYATFILCTPTSILPMPEGRPPSDGRTAG